MSAADSDVTGDDGGPLVDDLLAFDGGQAFFVLAPAGGGSLVVRDAPPGDSDDDVLVISGDAWPEGDGANGFLLLSAILPGGTTRVDLTVVEVDELPAAPLLVAAELPEGVLVLDAEEEDAEEPLDGWELELGEPGTYLLAISYRHAASPARGVLEIAVAAG